MHRGKSGALPWLGVQVSTRPNEAASPIPRPYAGILYLFCSYPLSSIPLRSCVSNKQRFLPPWCPQPQPTSRTKRSERDLMEPSSLPMPLPCWSCHSRYGVAKELAAGLLWALMRPSLCAVQLLSLLSLPSFIQVRSILNPCSNGNGTDTMHQACDRYSGGGLPMLRSRLKIWQSYQRLRLTCGLPAYSTQ
jgi:hypothetical protein